MLVTAGIAARTRRASPGEIGRVRRARVARARAAPDRMLPLCALVVVLGATIEELREASEALQAGELDDVGFEIFHRHAQEHPADWRAHAMLGQAQGKRGEHGAAVEALRLAHKLSPATAHLKIALASALTAKAHDDGDQEHSEVATLYRAALAPASTPGALPDDPVQRAETHAKLGRALLSMPDVDNQTVDEAIAAWSSAVALAPKQHEGLHELIAMRLIRRGDPAQRARAIQAAQRAVKLSPASAQAYETLGATFFIGHDAAASMGRKHRARAIRALETAIALWEEAAANDEQSREADRSARARVHSRLSRLLSSDPKLQDLNAGDVSSDPKLQDLNAGDVSSDPKLQDLNAGDVSSDPKLQDLNAGDEAGGSEGDASPTGSGEPHPGEPSTPSSSAPSNPAQPSKPLAGLSDEGVGLMREAVRHLRAAAKLDPATYSESAAKVAGWEEAERQYNQAGVKSQQEREAMVMAMHAEIDGKRREKEEDEEIEREERSERDARHRHDDHGGRRGGEAGKKPSAPKDEV
jgi:cytochrome c-type biogenesis protein CcmH/NrfG